MAPADAQAADWLRRGGIVLLPTETFYGLAVDPGSPAAVAALFDLKGRGQHSALPLIAASLEQVVHECGTPDPAGLRLARAFWPGPLSILLDAPAWVAPAVDAGTGAVAVRVPAHALARGVAAAFGRPITATSANRSGKPPASAVSMVTWLAADPRVLTLDMGSTPGGAPSTIVDTRGPTPVCVRAGAVPWDRVLRSLKP